MTRLVNAMRDGILTRLDKHTFTEKRAAMLASHAVLALEIYNDIYPPADRKRMDALPKSWLPQVEYLQIQAAGATKQFRFDGSFSQYGEYCNLYLRNIKPVYQRCKYGDKGTTWQVYDAVHPICGKITDFERSRDALVKDMQAAQVRARKTLETFSTVEKLIEAWPEIGPFIDEADRPAPLQLPALAVSDLNALFNLGSAAV